MAGRRPLSGRAALRPVAEALQPLPWQREFMVVPRCYDVAKLAGRGSGKTYADVLYVIREVEQFGARAKILFLRRDHTGGSDFVTKCLLLFPIAFGPQGFRYNSTTGVFKFHSGATLEVNQLADVADFAKFQGRDFLTILVDEAQQWPSPEPLDLVRSNLRSDPDLTPRVIITANSGGPGQSWLMRRYYMKAAPYEPFYEPASGREWVWIPSTLWDNDKIDREAYERQLVAACAHDSARLAGWRDNDWHATLAGTYFADAIDPQRNLLPAWDRVPESYGKRWRTWLTHDFGVAAPSVTLLMTESPGAEWEGQWFPRGSVVILDEFASNEPNSLTRGMGYGIARLAEEIHELARCWGVRPDGCADDACFSRGGHAVGTVADEFRQHGVHFWPARKSDRLGGWTRMRTMLAAAGSLDQPGLYVSERARYWLETVPTLPRDPRKPDDVDSRGPDHAADACRYGLLYLPRVAEQRDMYARRAF